MTFKSYLAFFGMIVGMFMAILDIQIVASSLSVIGAGLSASLDELSWVQTSYMIAEVVIIPIAGFLARLLSTRIFYSIATFGFTIMSILCSLAWNIESMIVFRALQGFFGGAMIPTIFATIFMIFPPKDRMKVNLVVGLVVTIAPTIGPTLGGYITDISSWHLMFLLNVIPGIFVTTVVFLYADFDKPNHKLIENFDYIGVVLIIISLGSIQYVLEEGNKDGWFDSGLIIILTIVAITCFVGLIIRELHYGNPILDFTTFKEKNFSIGCMFSIILGIGLFSVVYIMPLFLYKIGGMNTFQIGIVMFVTGISQFLSAPVVGKLYSKASDKRIILIIGLSMFSFGCYLNSFLTHEARFWEFFWPQVIRGSSLMFCFIPINDITFNNIAKDKIQNASGLYNLMRNLGGAMGIATIATMLTNFTKISAHQLASNITLTDPKYVIAQEQFAGIMDGKIFAVDGVARSILNSFITRDAFIIAINDIFCGISLMFAFSIILIFFTDKVNLQSQGEAIAH